MFRTLDDSVAVAPQIRPDDLPALRAAGFTTLINNRPDGEEPGQPTGESMRDAAVAAGLDYVAIPVGHGGFARDQLAAMATALAAAPGPVLAFCRSGTRSCYLWALAEASCGNDPEALTVKAGAAGYDLGAIRPLLDTLAAER